MELRQHTKEQDYWNCSNTGDNSKFVKEQFVSDICPGKLNFCMSTEPMFLYHLLLEKIFYVLFSFYIFFSQMSNVNCSLTNCELSPALPLWVLPKLLDRSQKAQF